MHRESQRAVPNFLIRIGVKMKDFIDTLFNRVYTETTTREFIISKEFDRVWKELGLGKEARNGRKQSV